MSREKKLGEEKVVKKNSQSTQLFSESATFLPQLLNYSIFASFFPRSISIN